MTQQETNRDSQQTADEATGTNKTTTVLVVDDDAAMIASTTSWLEEAGYSVIAARNGQQAVEVFSAQGEDIDLVILDLVMPRMSGEECLDRLVEIDPDVRVIGTSGYYIDDETYSEIEPKVKAFIPKPINPPMLLKLVERILHPGQD